MRYKKESLETGELHANVSWILFNRVRSNVIEVKIKPLKSDKTCAIILLCSKYDEYLSSFSIILIFPQSILIFLFKQI